jgi:hypothetical protein
MDSEKINTEAEENISRGSHNGSDPVVEPVKTNGTESDHVRADAIGKFV